MYIRPSKRQRPDRPASGATRGFTLVETMTVIGIMVVLLSVAVPTLKVVRDEAKATSCRTSLREIGIGISTYRMNMGERIPSCEPLPALVEEGVTEGGLPDVLDGYIDKDCTCWICSADEDPESVSAGTSYIYIPGLLRYAPQIQITVGRTLVPLAASGNFDAEELELLRRNLEANELTPIFEHERGRLLPLLTDSQDRHPNNSSVPRNGLFIDGSVAQLREELGDLQDDLPIGLRDSRPSSPESDR
ncbi:MAG: prepilin-type N-terminal cleavage/methylation domain-containing protein [Planctomycetota bacterium]|nr:prepilin-type N-terminal cleavage/methylation domain-containing protein [Planctomycetota bacterium]